MKHYLQNIRQARPINYPSFLKKLPQEIARRHRDYFRVEKVSAQRWLVTCIDPAIMAHLEALATTPENRTQAARQGDSHRLRTQAAFVLVYREGLPDERPDVVYLSPSSQVQGFKQKPFVLVVENEDNFAANGPMLAFASECLGRKLSLTNCDAILGGGNRVSRPLVAHWLAGYEQVLCAFDYDLGGLKMYRSLRGQLGEKVELVQPDDWSRWEEAFLLPPRHSGQLVEAAELASQFGFSGLAETFMNTRKFMEQEMILDGQ